MKRQVFITRKVSSAILQCVLDANNKYEVGGILLGYNLGNLHLVVAATLSDNNTSRSRISFLLDGAEHTRKVADIASAFICSPSVLGVWHSHICDGHSFSAQDKLSNRILAKSLDGTLSMLVSNPSHAVLFSSSYISAAGHEEVCRINFKKMERRIIL